MSPVAVSCLGALLVALLGAPVRAEAPPTPAEHLGFELGTRHATPEQIGTYAERLARTSPRVLLLHQGRTWEGRDLPLLVISDPTNLARLDQLLERQRDATDPRRPSPASAGPDRPIVVWLGYSVHGNEASGANASMRVAFDLATSSEPEIEARLRRTIVLVDPTLNPDGLGRFTTWVNAHESGTPVDDPAHREHHEAWPGGRGNHYWFDLNRDWLLLQQPESRARLAILRRFRPHVVGDFHEMGSDRTVFFQPGVPTRQNPLTPPENLDLTRRLATHLADAFDRAGRLYYTEETYDDFYYGKGSTYPDVNGAVGVLFEQASARGRQVQTKNGLLELAVAIDHQVRASHALVAGADALHDELLAYRGRFFDEALADGEHDRRRAFVFGDPGAPSRTRELADLILAHGIEIADLRTAVVVGGRRFEPGSSFAVPLDQPAYRLLSALFDVRTGFEDEVFYDVSAWTLPLAFGIPWATADGTKLDLGPRQTTLADRRPGGHVPTEPAPYAYLMAWLDSGAPPALADLHALGLDLRVTTRPLRAETDDGPRPFAAGTIVVPVAGQPLAPSDLFEHLVELGHRGLSIWGLGSGLTPTGIDLGSPSIEPIPPPRPGILVGSGTSATGAGGLWYLLDRRFQLPTSLIDRSTLATADLHRYSHLLIPPGGAEALDQGGLDRLTAWLEAGGIVVAIDDSAADLGSRLYTTTPQEAQEASTERRPYAEAEADRARARIPGTILEVDFDLTHPLAFGLPGPRGAVLRRGNHLLPDPVDRYETFARYRSDPLLAGFAPAEALEQIALSPAGIARRRGRGLLVLLGDDPSFRGVFRGVETVLANALFFGSVVQSTAHDQEDAQ